MAFIVHRSLQGKKSFLLSQFCTYSTSIQLSIWLYNIDVAHWRLSDRTTLMSYIDVYLTVQHWCHTLTSIWPYNIDVAHWRLSDRTALMSHIDVSLTVQLDVNLILQNLMYVHDINTRKIIFSCMSQMLRQNTLLRLDSAVILFTYILSGQNTYMFNWHKKLHQQLTTTDHQPLVKNERSCDVNIKLTSSWCRTLTTNNICFK